MKLRIFGVALMFMVCGVLIFSGCSGGSTASPNGRVYKIGLTQFATHPAADGGRQGFIMALKDAGFEEGRNVTFDYQNPEGDSQKGKTIARSFVAEKVDLIFSFGTGVSQAAVEAVRGTSIPVVFCSVTDPVGSGLVSDFQHSGQNITGTSALIDVKSSLEMVRLIVPGLKTLGTLYNPSEQNSVFLNNNLKAAAAAMQIRLLESTVASEVEVEAAARSLVGQVDAVWIGTDNTVVQGLKDLIAVTQSAGIPLFPSDDDSVRSGGIACLGLDDYQLGYQTGQMAVKILNGTAASQIPVEAGSTYTYSVNLSAAQAYSVTIPQTIMDRTYAVYR